MLKGIKNIVWNCFTSIDARLKFPNLKEGGIGIQVGFDMHYPTTSDLFTMAKRIGTKGRIIGIDPDPKNHQIASNIIEQSKLPIQLIQKGTYSKKDQVEFLIGEQSSWNQLAIVPKDSTVSFTGEQVIVEINTLDSILKDIAIDLSRIQHINLTINGSEYETLKGMKNLFKQLNDLSITVIAGRFDESGTIDGQPDYELILDFLVKNGFKTRFKRINQLFWWGFVTKLLLNRQWIYNRPNFGVIMASKGNHNLKWYQSFS